RHGRLRIAFANLCLAVAHLPPCSSHTTMASCANPIGGGEMPMSSMRSEFPADLLAGEPSVGRLPSRKRPSRFLITFCIGVAATLAWQSYGDAARETISSAYPQLGWLRRSRRRRRADLASGSAQGGRPRMLSLLPKGSL